MTNDDIPVIHLVDWPGLPEGVWPNKPKGPCGDCGTRPATLWFLPDGGPDAAHGGCVPRCERCFLATAIAHCERAAARLPELRARLAEIDAEERSSTLPVERPRSGESTEDGGGRCGMWHDW